MVLLLTYCPYRYVLVGTAARQRNKERVSYLHGKVQALTQENTELKGTIDTMSARIEELTQENRTLLLNQLAGSGSGGTGMASRLGGAGSLEQIMQGGGNLGAEVLASRMAARGGLEQFVQGDRALGAGSLASHLGAGGGLERWAQGDRGLRSAGFASHLGAGGGLEQQHQEALLLQHLMRGGGLPTSSGVGLGAGAAGVPNMLSTEGFGVGASPHFSVDRMQAERIAALRRLQALQMANPEGDFSRNTEDSTATREASRDATNREDSAG